MRCQKDGSPSRLPPVFDLLCPASNANAINVFRRQPQPFQEFLVRGGVLRLKDLVPLFHLGVVQADLAKHRDPLLHIDLIFHVVIWLFSVVSRP